jgi:phosphoglucomutase/phosphomannomutase
MEWLAQAAEGFRTIEADATLKELALKFLRQWLTEAEFVPYRAQLRWLIETNQWPGLLDRFYQILPFGTGGRRGAVGIGPNRMNPWTLRASVQGHCEYLREKYPGASSLRVVLAYDVRQFEDQRRQYNHELPNPVLHLSSRDLAQHAACVYVANGIDAFILPPDSRHFLATPELSFTLRYMNAHGGLNISASHNPPDDNGGKFYDERGGQPVPPDDQIMADLVDQVRVIKSLPWTEAQRCSRLHWLDEAPHRAYIDLCCKQSLVPPPKLEECKIVFTPLHGVGALTAMETLIKQGFCVIPVAEQMTPDGQFTNVTKTPNPEVPESMDRAAATARTHNADLVLATDPDADRLGAMVPDKHGVWNVINGNQMAALLTHFKLNKLTQQGRLPSSPIVISTEVTTKQVTRIARHFKAQVIDDLLVGFKYIADALWHLEHAGAFEDVSGTPEDFVLAVEESHGVLVTPHIRDKDAAGAALLMAELTLDQKRRQQTVVDYRDRLAREFGYYRNEGVAVFMRGLEGKQEMARMLDRLRATPPRTIAGLQVTDLEDLRDERGRFGPLKGATDAASRNVLQFRCGERARIVLRPSGTEPKAKMYLEASTPPRPAGMSEDAWIRSCREVDGLIERMAEDFKRQALQLIGMDSA